MKRKKYLVLFAILIMMSNISVSADNKEKTKDGKALDNITLGVIIGGNNPEEELKQVKDLGLSHCQLSVSKYSPELAKRYVNL